MSSKNLLDPFDQEATPTLDSREDMMDRAIVRGVSDTTTDTAKTSTAAG